MGSAVSGVTGSVQGSISGVEGIPGDVSSGNYGAAAEGALGLGSLTGAQSALNSIGTVSAADQTALQNQITQQQALASQNQAQSGVVQGQANQSLANVQQAQGTAQGILNEANDLNASGRDPVSQSIALLQAQANGTAPSAAQAVLQSGKNQAIAAQQAIANSGNASQMISGQKTALDNAANLTQQAANQATQLQATQQQVGQQNFANAASTQAQTANANAALQQQQAAQQASLYGTQVGQATNLAGIAQTGNAAGLGGQAAALGQTQGALTATGQNQAAAAGGGLNAAGGILAAVSDENSKYDIGSVEDVSSYQPSTGQDMRAAEGIVTSDKKAKKDVSKKDKIDKFLDAIDPVKFKYKDPDGQMGKTPGEHLGVIAQQVEKAPGGKSMIIETPQGKGIDLASAVGTLLAAAAHTHDRVRDLEDLFKSKKKK